MLLTTKALISRMTPTALAETIAAAEQFGNLDAAEQATVALLRQALEVNVGAEEAAEMVKAAR